MPEHDGSVDGAGRRRGPTRGDACIEHLVGGRSVIPHGDRVHAAESGRIEHEEAPRVGRSHDHIVREFILNHDIDDLAAMRAAPDEHILERLQTIESIGHTYWFSREQNQR